MDKAKQNSPKKITDKESEELNKIDKDLKDLIDKNESLKKGISKLFTEIDKNITNQSK